MSKAGKIVLVALITVLNCLPIFAQSGKWTQLHPTNSPSARMGHGMTPIGDDKVLLFGGLLESFIGSYEYVLLNTVINKRLIYQ